MSKAIALLAGFGAGYMNGEKDKKEQARQDAKDKREKDLFDANMADRQQVKDDRDALRSAAAPALARAEQGPPTEAMVAQTPPGQEPAAIGYLSGNGASARKFATQGLAEADAAAQNQPEAARGRVMAALAAQGNVVGADQLRTSGITAEASQLALNKGRRDEANQVFDQGIKSALQTGGPQALAEFMSNSQADGQGGAVKFQAVTAPDGKTWQMNRVGQDGKTVPFGQSFASDEGGLATAGMMLSRAVPDAEKVKHLMAETEASRKAKHDDGTLEVAKQNANTNEQYRRDMAANMREQRRLQESRDAQVAAGKAQAGGAIQIGLKDMRDFEGDFNGYIKDQFPVKEGADANERAGLNAQATSMKALGSAMFQNNAAIGIPLTAGTVMQAMELGKDRKNVQIVQVNGVAREAVVVNGQHVITSGPLQKRAPAAAAPAANSAAAVAQAGVAAPVERAGVQTNQVAQQFNAAGYADVQATIDGAKRGDRNALTFLDVLIKRGQTTPAQRQQIAIITQ